MQAIEIRHVAHAQLEEIIEVPRHQMAIEDKRQFRDGVLEVREAIRRRAIEHHADNHKGCALDAMRVISNLPILDVALIDPERRHEISVRATLDVRTMPDTLRFILFWADDWRQRSEWYTWSPQL